METTTEKHNGTEQRDQQIEGSMAQVNATTSQLLHLWLWKHHEREGGKTVRARIPGSLLCILSYKWLHK